MGTVDKGKKKDDKWEHNSEGRAALPDRKIEKLRELLRDLGWDLSNRLIKLHPRSSTEAVDGWLSSSLCFAWM